MLYDKIVLTHEDILLISCIIENDIKLNNSFLTHYSPRSKNAKRINKLISCESALLEKLRSIKQITYDKD